MNGRKIIEVEYEKKIIDGEVKMMRCKKDISLFDHVSIYNEVEQLNKNHTMFISVLNKLIQKAGHEMEFNIVEKPKKKKNDDDEETMGNILANIDETEYDFKKLMKKQSNNKLTKL